MDIVLEEIFAGLPDVRQMVSLMIRLLTAMVLGSLVGVQRESSGKPAGLRTHILVAMGGALFVSRAARGWHGVGRHIAGDSRLGHGNWIHRSRRYLEAAGKKRDRRTNDGSRYMDDRRDWNRCRFGTLGARIGEYGSDVDNPIHYRENRK